MATETVSPWAHKLPRALQIPQMDPKERFYRQFQRSVTEIQEQIQHLPTFAAIGGERQDAVEHILSSIARLSNEVADASDYVPAYDQRTYAEAIKALTDRLNETMTKLAPKPRFQFKPRPAATTNTGVALTSDDPRRLVGTAQRSATANTASSEQQDTVGALPLQHPKNYNQEIASTKGGVRKPSFSSARDIAISDHNDLHIILPSSAARATSAGALTNLRNCIVDMSLPTGQGAPFASLALKNINRSLIIAGHVSGPVHITAVRDSVVVVVARQVRIHECKNVTLYLHCASHPIIEDCKDMNFAPAPPLYLTGNEAPEKNQWDQVDDFKWLKPEPSPNWKIVNKDERISEDIWTDTVSEGFNLSVDEILRKVLS